MTEGHTERLGAALAGRYRIERKLGEGGMASVYLAEDLKHERKVALKILRPELAAVIGGERFLSEIKTTANLQHPHILPLYDSGEAEGYLFYVMPYIDGETLADKLAREKQLGVEEAVSIARSVASALDYAHRHDVIHRDIKPANILLHDGNPIVADFGIALAVSAAGGGRMTETGLSLGTPHYMSPEQASADRDLSARSDVYSLGCVLYEMIAGQPPHTGPSAQNILIRILTERPQPLTELRHTVPPHVSAVVAKSIEKLPADRFESARDFAQALDDASFEYSPAGPRTVVTAAATGAAARSGATPSTSTGWPRWVTAAMAVLALGAGYALTRLTIPAPTEAPSAAFTLVTDSTHGFASLCCGRAVAISPQGDRIVYLAIDQGGRDKLYQRPLGQQGATPIPGTEGGRHPFFSPNGEWLAFFDQGTGLKKVRFDGAAPLPLAPVAGAGLGASWSDNGDIYFSDRGLGSLLRVSEDGGDASLVAEPDTTTEFFIGWPAELPGGDHVLVTSGRDDGSGQLIAAVEVLDLASGERRRLLENASDARYVEPGYIVFSDMVGSIMAQSFDLRRLELTGERFRIADRAVVRDDAHAEYDVSRNGTLVMLASLPRQQESDLVILDRAGNAEVLDLGRDATLPRFSPDGRHLAFTVFTTGAPADIWVWDLEREVPTRVTFEGDNLFPSWSPDGASILFQRSINGEEHGYMVRRDGTGTPARIIDYDGRTPSMSRDGQWLVWGTSPSEAGGSKIWVKDTDSEEERMLLGGRFPEFQPAISPDGRWIAYVAEDDGDDQVYVQRFPELGPRVKISTEGGREPRWSQDGSELFFRDYASGNLISVEVLPSEEVFEPGEFRELFPHGGFARAASATIWDVHPDGERFVFVRGQSDGGTGVSSSDERWVITNALSRER